MVYKYITQTYFITNKSNNLFYHNNNKKNVFAGNCTLYQIIFYEN